MIILVFLGHPWTSIFGTWGGLGCPFWGSGGVLGRVWRAVVTKDRLPKLAAQSFKRFWIPNGALEAKMELTSLTNPFKNLSIFWLDFYAVSGAFVVN